jgi:hypothetical protein
VRDPLATLQAIAIAIVGFGALGFGLYQLTGADTAGSLFRAIAGLGGFFLVCALTTALMTK